MDPQVQALLQMMEAQAGASGVPPMWELPAHVAREGAETAFQVFNQGAPEIGAIYDRTIPGPAGELPIKVFVPVGSGPFPLLVYLHGGGWVIGSPNTHLKLCAELAGGGDVVIVSVHYRLAPEHPAPAPLDDVVAAIRWSVANAQELNADATRFAVAGDSAGANLAASAALRLRDEGGPMPSFLLLLYGAYTGDLDLPSVIENAEGKILTRPAMKWFYEQYLSGGADPTHPYITPIRANLRGLPPTRLIVGTLDPLLDDSKLLAAKLEEAGVSAQLSIYQDMPHVFMQLSAMLDGGKRGVAEACTALREALSPLLAG